jgi:hypothetical protein
MAKVAAAVDSNSVIIAGHGISVRGRHELRPGVYLEPSVPNIDLDRLAKGVDAFREYAAIVSMTPLATFSLVVEHPGGGEQLAIRAWNALWDFYLLSLASAAPCFSLFSASEGTKPVYAVANRNLVINPLSSIHELTPDQIKWATDNRDRYDVLCSNDKFTTALRYYGSAHYLFDYDARIMLLWAGIEGLLDIEGEQRHRSALYAALLFDGSPNEKHSYYEQVKRAYQVRSKVVHGSKGEDAKLIENYGFASSVLIRLLAKCVELAKVPSPKELDFSALSSQGAL